MYCIIPRGKVGGVFLCVFFSFVDIVCACMVGVVCHVSRPGMTFAVDWALKTNRIYLVM